MPESRTFHDWIRSNLILIILLIVLVLISPVISVTVAALTVPTFMDYFMISSHIPAKDWGIIEFNETTQQNVTKSANREKLTMELFELLGDYNVPACQSISDKKEQMHQSGKLLYKNDPSAAKEGLMPGDDLIYIYITLNAGADTNVIDHFVWKIVSRDEKNCLTAAWVEINQLHPLISLSDVRNIQTVEPPWYDDKQSDLVGTSIDTWAPRGFVDLHETFADKNKETIPGIFPRNIGSCQ